MDIPETLATTGNKTQHEDKKKHKNTIQQRKPKRPGMNPGARKGLAVPSFYKTPIMLIIKSCRRREKFYLKWTRLIEIWIFRNG